MRNRTRRANHKLRLNRIFYFGHSYRSNFRTNKKQKLRTLINFKFNSSAVKSGALKPNWWSSDGDYKMVVKCSPLPPKLLQMQSSVVWQMKRLVNLETLVKDERRLPTSSAFRLAGRLKPFNTAVRKCQSQLNFIRAIGTQWSWNKFPGNQRQL